MGGSTHNPISNSPAPEGGNPQGVLDQFLGLFTVPEAVFRRLRVAPSWAGAFSLSLGLALFATLTWAAKVDLEAVAERKFEVLEQAFHVTVPPATIDKAIEEMATHGRPFVSSALGVLLVTPLLMFILAGTLFAFAKVGGTDEKVTFRHAWAATTVQGLVLAPVALLAGIMCLLRDVGGAASYLGLAPTQVAFWIHPENPWLRGLLTLLDPFYLFSFVALYLAARYTLGLKTWALVTLLSLTGLISLSFRLLSGLF